jgi:hypothetical protein
MQSQRSAGEYEADVDPYLLKKYDYIPILPGLIGHVRRIDGFKSADVV